MLRNYVCNLGAGEYQDASVLLQLMDRSLSELLRDDVLEFGRYKVAIVLQLRLLKQDGVTGDKVFISFFVRTRTTIILNDDDVRYKLDSAAAEIDAQIDEFVRNGSGWIVDHVEAVYLELSKFEPMGGGTFIHLPQRIKAKTACLNVINNDDRCLQWALLAAKHHEDVGPNNTRVSKYVPYVDELNFAGVEFPASMCAITTLEQNNVDLAVNVFGISDDGKTVVPLRLTRKGDPQEAINLLLFSGQTEDERNVQHWVFIKNMSRLVANKSSCSRKVCYRCLNVLSTQAALESHQLHCKDHLIARAVMPQKGEKLRFTQYEKQLRAPYVIYADFESIIAPHAEPKSIGGKTKQHSEHIPCSAAYIVVRSDGTVTDTFQHTGEDSVEQFLTSLELQEVSIREDLENRRPMNLTPDEEAGFLSARDCWICKRRLGGDRVRDHDHMTGAFRGAAHNSCNLQLRIVPGKVNIPVVFHNLKGYDAHHIVSHLGKTKIDEVTYQDAGDKEHTEQRGSINIVPSNTEKYIAMMWRQFVFIDSYAFLSTSLDKLAKATPGEAFVRMRDLHGGDPEKTDLLLRKGVYPYEYMDSFSRFDEESLPPREKFYSSLSEAHITDDEYRHAQTVWNRFDCVTLRDYHDLYLKTDVYLLADVFENFRTTAIATYSLDPANYYTLPGFAWSALLKVSDVSLDLLSDVTMHTFIEHGIRGGISMSVQRYAEANNDLIPDGYDPSKPMTYLQYVDANNLYGWAMQQPLPIGDFKFVEDISDDLVADIVMTHPHDSPVGYIVECDLTIPDGVHDALNEYPPCPENMCVTDDMLSPHQQQLAQQLGLGKQKEKKLMLTLLPKTRYVCHYVNLQAYVALGVEVSEVHRVLQFTQRPWMRLYIQLNTDLRTNAASEFEKDFYKLMNNAVFGKTMENVRRRLNLKLVRSEEEVDRLRRAIVKPTYKRSIVYDNDLVAVEFFKCKVHLNKPIYVGFSILELSKVLMYSFFYDTLKPRYGQNVRLCYTDTDSFILQYATADLYADMSDMMDQYDTSNYPTDHPLHSLANKKVVGKFKDELGGRIMSEFVGLRSMMYAYTGEESAKRAKGVKKSVVNDTLQFSTYKDCLLRDQQSIEREMNVLRSRNHHIYGETIRKVALSPFDSKRYILDDGVSTLAYGHYKIPA
ncbi:uncharacterized protein LOC135810614 [Sycon ciliatum]|uniref:uncharacterized protein LOC135810614 n=1 Tax=Sycon ciliatum TaxID=27933 RepID=UPI0031F70FE4